MSRSRRPGWGVGVVVGVAALIVVSLLPRALKTTQVKLAQPEFLIDAIRNDNCPAIAQYVAAGGSLNAHKGGPDYYGNGLDYTGHPSDSASGELPITVATGWQRAAFIKYLVGHGAKVDERTSHGLTALHYACMRSNGRMAVTALLDCGADVNAIGATCVTPLDVARMDRPEVIEALLDHGARLNLGVMSAEEVRRITEQVWKGNRRELPKPWLESSRKRLASLQETLDRLLRKAVVEGHAETTKMLLVRGADPNSKDPKTGLTPLYLAVRGSDGTEMSRYPLSADCVRLLLQHGAKVRESVDKDGVTALHWACRAHNYPICELLLNAGADPNAKTKDGVTPYKSVPLVEDLLR